MLASVLPAAVPAALSAGACASTTQPTYIVTVCIAAPAAGASLTGDATVTGTVSVTGANPGVSKMVFWLDDEYVLTDYQSPYQFVLKTPRWVDSTRVLRAQPRMRDGVFPTEASVSVDFANGVTEPPVNTGEFTPTRGTTPSQGQPVVVATVGDGASGEANGALVTNMISGWDPNLFLYLGDVYEQGTTTEFDNWYAPSTYFGRFRAITDPVIGNHENLTEGSAGYFDYWDNPPNYYSIDVAGWHVVALDSTGTLGETRPGTAQYTWLQNDLSAHPNACTLVSFHHPAWSIGEGFEGGDDVRVRPLWPLLADSGVDVVLNGHDHDYYR